MAGGNFLGHNKVRPGAYINFVAVPKPSSVVGARGVAALPLSGLPWGSDYIELYSTDLLDGKSIEKIGVSATDEEALVLRLALSNAYKLLIARTDVNGVKATAYIAGSSGSGVKATARYAGILGNKLSIVIKKVAETGFFDVFTNLNKIQKDVQRVKDGEGLRSNNWVDFTVETAKALTQTAGVELSGGTNGTESNESVTAALNTLSKKNWNTIGLLSENSTLKQLASQLIRRLRDKEGRKCQLVLLDAGGSSGENYEGILTCKQGIKDIDGNTITSKQFIAYLTGLTAGSTVIQSNTYHVIKGAVEVVGKPDTHEEIVEGLKTGYIVLSYRSDGAVVIEQDINSLCEYPSDKSYAFSKNRVMRCLDEIGNTVSLMWQKTYLGKVNNNKLGRDLFKADIINYFKQLQDLGAIQDFNKDTDVEVLQGNNLDEVICNTWVKPVDSMEKLYLTVNVNG